LSSAIRSLNGASRGTGSDRLRVAQSILTDAEREDSKREVAFAPSSEVGDPASYGFEVRCRIVPPEPTAQISDSLKPHTPVSVAVLPEVWDNHLEPSNRIIVPWTPTP